MNAHELTLAEVIRQLERDAAHLPASHVPEIAVDATLESPGGDQTLQRTWVREIREIVSDLREQYIDLWRGQQRLLEQLRSLSDAVHRRRCGAGAAELGPLFPGPRGSQ